MALYTADWNPLGRDVFYRKIELYEMNWGEQVNLLDFIVAPASFGGPIAIIRDDKKIQRTYSSGKSDIIIFSSSGKFISSRKWDSGKLIHLAWSSSEDLLCIQEDGMVLVYDIFGNLQDTFSLGQEAKDTKVIECKVFSSYKHFTGIAVFTGSYRIFYINNTKDPRIKLLPEIPGLDTPPSSWTVICDNGKIIFLVAKDNHLFMIDSKERKWIELFPKFLNQFNAIIEMAVSSNKKNICLFTDTGNLWIGTSDLKEKYCEFDTESRARPQQLLWCGNRAVVGYWQNILLIVGPEKDFINYIFDSPVILVPEIDGIRIIGNTSHELLQKVPYAVMEIFRIGSVSPGALLHEAFREFQKRSHKADEYLRMIREKGQLELAVKQCIEAAGHEFTVMKQKQLLRAASFGKSFIPNMNPEEFVQMCQTLRVLNAIRGHEIGLPLTYRQYSFLTVPVFLDRLVLRRHYYLAIKICQYLRIPDKEGSNRILAQWACYKVKPPQLDPDRVANQIAEKVGFVSGISYSEIANKAIEYGNTKCAIKLLDYEVRASEQVPLLIKLNQDIQAMSKAIDSGESDLIYYVILHLKDSMDPGKFHMTLRNFSVAYALFLKLCKEQDLELLRNIYYQEDDFASEGNCRILESYQQIDKRITTLQLALDSYKKAKNDFAVKCTEEQIQLVKYQQKLEVKFSHKYVDLSVHQTIVKLLKQKEYKLAEALCKDFKTPDKRYWWLKIGCLAETGDWLELEKFSKSKKSPIGYEPFIDVCMKYNNKYEAYKYISKIKEENKVKYLTKIGKLEEAAKLAFDQKDDSALNTVLKMCTNINPGLAEKIKVMKFQLSNKR